MASIHQRQGSKFWYCSFYDSVAGKGRFKSTVTAGKEEAQVVCLAAKPRDAETRS